MQGKVLETKATIKDPEQRIVKRWVMTNDHPKKV